MVVVAGTWELGWNTPIIEKDLWIYPLRDMGVDEFAMTPISGISDKKVKEFSTIDDIINYYSELPLIIVDERGENNLREFSHPENALYLLGKANYSPLISYFSKGTSLKIETPDSDRRNGMLWPHQAISIVLYDKYIKSIYGIND